MENGARGGGVNGFGISGKEAAGGGGGAGNGNVVVVGSYGGLGEVMHTAAENNNNTMMGRHIHHHRHHDGFDGGDNGVGGGGGGGGAGPTSGANENNIYMYGDDVAAHTISSSSVPPFTVGGGGGGAVAVRLSQPFNCSSNSAPLPFKSPAMATSLGFPFTCAQWKELERQAMVYKYMMASVPVPPDLLLPIQTDTYTAAPNFHTQSAGSSGCVLGGFSGKNRDLEPGRCKRTDGKKWRCSKEVAPNQKYCERHLHRGRPRSRKPVEDHTLPANNTSNNSKKTRLQQPPPPPLESPPSMVISQPATSAPSSSQLLASSSDKHNEGPQSLDARMDRSFSISPFSEQHRSLDWEMVAMGGTEEQWQQLMEANTRLAFESNVYRDNNAQILQQMNLFHCKDYYGSIRQNGDCNLYFNPDLGSLNKEFINAWANGSIINNNNTNTDTGSCASPSALSLSVAMAAGNILDSEMGVQDGNAASCDDEHNTCSNLTLRSPVSWVPFASGGPLAEVLKPSQQHHHPSSSSYISNGDSISPAGTTVSSPSGVLQKTTLFSQSDGSVCNSPTLAAAELVPFQWLS